MARRSIGVPGLRHSALPISQASVVGNLARTSAVRRGNRCESSTGWRRPNGMFCVGLVLVIGWSRGFPSSRRKSRVPAARTA
jgi:hypothetical protein